MKHLECIHCGRDFKLNEVFVAFMDEQGIIVIASHMDCGEAQTKKERENTGWVVLERQLNGEYLIHK